MPEFIPSQGWKSLAEPELGLGRILSATRDQVSVLFRAAGLARDYGLENAPLQRVIFHPGDAIRLQDGTELPVLTATIRNGLVYYQTERGEVSEESLAD